jgi:hypothetical protein
MRAFIVNMANTPGTLAILGDVTGARGINIIGLSGVSWGANAAIAIVTNDDSGTRAALTDAGLEFRDVVVIPASLEDRPGALGQAARRLGERGINVEIVMPTGFVGGRVTVAFGVDDPEGAVEALGDLAVTGATAI